MSQSEERIEAIARVITAATLQKTIGLSGMISMLSDSIPRRIIASLRKDLFLQATEIDPETFLAICWILAKHEYLRLYDNDTKSLLSQRISRGIIDHPIVCEFVTYDMFFNNVSRAHEKLLALEHDLRSLLKEARRHDDKFGKSILYRSFPPYGHEDIDDVLYGHSLFLSLLERANVMSAEEVLSRIILFPFYKVSTWTLNKYSRYMDFFERGDNHSRWAPMWEALWSSLDTFMLSIYMKALDKRTIVKQFEEIAVMFGAIFDRAFELLRVTLALAYVECLAMRDIEAETFRKVIAELGFGNDLAVADFITMLAENQYGRLALQRRLAWEEGFKNLLYAIRAEISQCPEHKHSESNRKAMNIIVDMWISARQAEVGTGDALRKCEEALQEISTEIDEEARQRALDWLHAFKQIVDTRSAATREILRAARAVVPNIRSLGEIGPVAEILAQHLVSEVPMCHMDANQRHAESNNVL